MWARVMACETEGRAVNRNLAEAMVSDFDRFIIASCVLPLVLHCFFSTLVGVVASVLLRGNT